jgi:hypothetical protein
MLAATAGVLLERERRSAARAAAAPPVGYLEDSRTLRALRLSAPRAPLAAVLRVLGQAAALPLGASAVLAEETLVGYVPARPLRETMQALETLFEARWVAVGSGYELAQTPEGARAQAAARTAQLRRYRAALDEAARPVAAAAEAGKPPPDTLPAAEYRALLLWSALPPEERDRVLRGEVRSHVIPVEKAAAINRMMLVFSERPHEPLTGPVLATFDLDDRSDLAMPALRARATGRRATSIIAGIGLADLTRYAQPTREPPLNSAADGDPFPPEVGGTGRFDGTRDDVVRSLALACNLPILSRHRAMGGSAPGVVAGGRRLSQVLGELAAACDAHPSLTARGFGLLRPAGGLLDWALQPASPLVRKYLASRPEPGSTVSLEQLVPLGELTPGQLSVLSRENRCDPEADFVRGAYALVRFVGALGPAERAALASVHGLELASLPHAALHALVDERAKRGELNIFAQLQNLPGLHLRFQVLEGRTEDNLVMQALRGPDMVAGAVLTLPVVEPDELPAASR